MPVMNFYGVCVCSSPAELMALITATFTWFSRVQNITCQPN